MWVETWRQDARFALRQLRRNVGLTAIAVLTLALGIGANTALFSVVNGVLLAPLPYPHSDRLVAIYEVAPGFDKGPMSYLNFLDWQRMSRTFASMAIYRNQDYNFGGGGERSSAERVTGMMVSADFFRTLGQTAVAGRDLARDDDRVGAAPVVLGGGFWQRRFAGSRSIVGQTIALNGQSYTVIGVMPASFTLAGSARDVYTPIGQWNDPNFRDRGVEVSTHAIGRLAPGVSLAQAQADLRVVARDLASTYPTANKNIGIAVVGLKDDLVGNVQRLLYVLLGAVGCLLLIACVNVANLLLARALGRSREFAVRIALGATRARLARQLFTESAILAVLGGVLGLAIAIGGVRFAHALLLGALPRIDEVGIDGRVLFFTLSACLFSALLFGLAPAMRGGRTDVQRVLKESGRGTARARHRAQRAFVAAQVGLALVLLAGACLMVRSLGALWRVDPGFAPHHAITFSVSLPATPNTTPADTRARLRRLDRAIRDVPGVDAVSVTLGSRPMIHDTSLPFWIDGQAKPGSLHDMPAAMLYFVESGFRDAMGLTLRRGRFVSDDDDERAAIVVDVDDAFAARYFPGADPIGKRINITGFDVQAEIVGVVAHVKQWGLAADPANAVEGQLFYPFMQLPDKIMALAGGGVAVVLRTRGDPQALMAKVSDALKSAEPGDVIYATTTLDDVIATSLAPRRLTMMLLAGFAALAVTIACIGLYGVISYLVNQRRLEIGVRVALGAQRGEVMRLVLGDALRMALLGAAMGLVAALGLARFLEPALFGVTAHDPLTFAAVAVALVSVAMVATLIPARRATRVDPAVALRAE